MEAIERFAAHAETPLAVRMTGELELHPSFGLDSNCSEYKYGPKNDSQHPQDPSQNYIVPMLFGGVRWGAEATGPLEYRHFGPPICSIFPDPNGALNGMGPTSLVLFGFGIYEAVLSQALP